MRTSRWCSIGPDGSERKLLVGDQLFVHVGGGVILGDRLRLALNLPIAAYEKGEDARAIGTAFSAPSSAGSVIFASRPTFACWRIRRRFHRRHRRAGAPAHGQTEDYTGDGKVRVVPRLMAAGDLGPFAYALKVGLQYRGLDENFANSPIGTELQVSAAAGFVSAIARC